MGGVRKKSTPPKREEPRPFEEVWRIVRRIPKGKVLTYGQISELVARRLTPVGVGWAVRAAPEGTIPWQRVVNGKGGISTDREHPGLQRQMLESEGVTFDREGLIDLVRFGFHPKRA